MGGPAILFRVLLHRNHIATSGARRGSDVAPLSPASRLLLSAQALRGAAVPVLPEPQSRGHRGCARRLGRDRAYRTTANRPGIFQSVGLDLSNAIAVGAGVARKLAAHDH